MKPSLKTSGRRQIISLETLPKQIPSWMQNLEPGEYVRLLRQHFHMTQTQLSHRSGVPQAKIARIESMQTDFKWSTLRRLFAAMETDPLLLPRPHSSWDVWLRARAHEVAQKRVARVSGTSALEAQQPGEKERQDMVKDEEQRLLESGGSELWNEE